MTAPADILWLEGDTAPSAPAAGRLLLYAKTDDKFYIKNSAGVETELGSGGGGGSGTVIDGGAPDSTYTGSTPIDGGTP